MKYTFLKNAVIVTLLSAFAVGCSGGGGGGTKNATIDTDNAEALATAGTEGVKQGANNDSASLFAQTGKPSPMQKLTLSTAQSIPKAETIAGICDSGSVDETFGEKSGSITYNNCVIAGATFNGSATYSTSTSGSITTIKIVYKNFTITYDGKTETIDLSTTCKSDSNANTFSCTYDSTAEGIDGRTYKVTDIEVSGNASSGWSVTATVQDPDYGKVTIETITPVTFNCSNGQPDSGSIKVTTPKNSMTVTYIDCTSFSIDFDGSTTTYNW